MNNKLNKVHFLYADGSIGTNEPVTNSYRTRFEMKAGDRIFLVNRDVLDKGKKGRPYCNSFKEVIAIDKAKTPFEDKSGIVKANYDEWLIRTRTIVDSPNRIYIDRIAKEMNIAGNGYTAFCYDNNTPLSLRHSKSNYEKMYKVAERVLMLLCR